jgi:uncharacterized protein (DUF1684 family)
VTEVEEFRREKDAFFRTDARSPLSDRQKRRFTGLDYYPEDHELTIAGEIDPRVDPTDVLMDTTGGTPQRYHRAGVLRFRVGYEHTKITLFAREPGGELFVPFRDATSGRETYGAGRYLDVEPALEGWVVVDFNYAYNPYCAYNANWSCPLPPQENWLPVAIRAGELSYRGEVAPAGPSSVE